MRPRNSVAQAPVDNGKKPRRPPKKRMRGSDVDGNQPNVEVIKVGARRAKWQPKPGKLAALMNLPLDVLFEIYFVWLVRPKEFRRVLMHRSSMSVWKNARDNVPNMPDCPPFWTEPHYANLAFDPHCHKKECGAPGGAQRRLAHRQAYLRKVLQDLHERVVFYSTARMSRGPEEFASPHRFSGLKPIANERRAFVKENGNVWNNIKNDMIKYMEEMKTRRLERERKALLIARKRTAIGALRRYKIAHLPFTGVMPEAVDFCSFPEVKAIVEMPTETEVTEASFAEVSSRMHDLVNSWRTHIHSQLRARVKDNLLFAGKRRASAERVTSDPLYQEYVESLGATIDVKGKKKEVSLPVPGDAEIDQMIPLATTVFRCKTCTPSIGLPGDSSDSEYDDFLDILGGRRSRSVPLFYPKVMGHCCLTRSRTLPWDYFATDDPNFRIDFPMSTRTNWNAHLLQVDEQASKAARTVVEACGEDPLITTATKMDELDPHLACLDCMRWSKHEVNQGEVPVFTWRSAVCALLFRVSDFTASNLFISPNLLQASSGFASTAWIYHRRENAMNLAR
ncbi:uncharacterized protein F5891DRAFT_1177098 [Suillus fuscotomentosus]|uniref:F-box domain-containing protein n=1 Tax=Suillus fuscotomentosus TaxID=1912939 RepID=A0AAD4DQG4_9AGAM|nr:uncharacterized protein F5891DRAFT_1177098 [Suillus fuscotomentosus]KAG1889682.1 hypothetical protein F5891DRAFT_1177098 [Suillus fuscotomentosus]